MIMCVREMVILLQVPFVKNEEDVTGERRVRGYAGRDRTV